MDKSKRPQTSKSLTFLLNVSKQKYKPLFQQNLSKPIQQQSLHLNEQKLSKKQISHHQLTSHQHQEEQQSQPTDIVPKKWQSIATQMNNQLHLQKLIYNRNSSVNLLTRYGGKVYRSESKGRTNEQRQRKQSQQRGKINKRLQIKEQLKQKNDQSVVYKYLKHGQRKNLRKRSKLPTNYNNQISKQLSINKLFYQNPVRKIGYNMQFQAKFRFDHLQRLQQYKGLQKDNFTNVNTRIQENPIIFYLKDSPFSAHIITQKNQQTPICISLFPEFFHSKLSSSNYIRQRYLQKMRQKMNNTYDPGVLGKMPMVTCYPPFNQQAYIKVLRQFIGNYQQCFQPRWAENIIKKTKFPVNSKETSHYLREIWELFNKSNAIINLDYILKDELYIKKFSISPYMSTKQITSKRILYHGGYSRNLYPSWSNFVKQGKQNLTIKLKKYQQITQSIWAWLLNFQDTTFFQSQFIKILNRPLSISLFKKLQQRKIMETQRFFRDTWMRGIILIWQEQMLLQTQKNQYKNLTEEALTFMKEEIVKLKRQLNVSKIGNKFLPFSEQKIFDSYNNYLLTLKSKNRRLVGSQNDFLSIYGKVVEKEHFSLYNSRSNQAINRPSLKQLKTMINIHYSQIIQKSISSLKFLINESKKSKNNQKQAILRLTLIVDRQNIKFKQKQEEIIQTFGQLIQTIFKYDLKSFQVKLDFSRQSNGNEDMNNKSDGFESCYDGKRKLTRFATESRQREKDRKMKKTIGYGSNNINKEFYNNNREIKNMNINNETQQQRQQRQIMSYPQVVIIDDSKRYENAFITSSKQQFNNNNNSNNNYNTYNNGFNNNYKSSSSLQLSGLQIKYSYPFNHQKQINSLLFKLHQYYKQSNKIINLFNQFMPFIKLTTSKYIFHDQQNIGKSPEDIFLKDLEIIQKYKSQLSKIQTYQRIKIFEISCQQPLRQLNNRMNQVEYLIEQKYLNKIFDQVHDIQKPLNQIKNDIQSKQVKITNVDQLQDKVHQYEQQMQQVQISLKQLQKKILFCIEVQKINSTLILRYQQVVNKKKDVQKQVKAFKIKLRQSRPQLQNRIKKQCHDVNAELQKLTNDLQQLQGLYIDAGQIQKFLTKIQQFGQRLEGYQNKLKDYAQSAQYVLPSQDVENKLQQFNKICSTYDILHQFWKGVFTFQSYLRQQYKQRVPKISMSQFQQILISSQQISKKIVSSQSGLMTPLIHKCQQHYLQKFQQDINRCIALRPVITILCNSKIQDRHWKVHECENLRNMTLFELMKQQFTVQVMNKLQQMNQRAQIQFKVYDVYETIRKQLKNKKIRIIDVNGSDVLDIQLSSDILEMLYNWKIECQLLVENQASQFFHVDILKLSKVINSSYEHLIKWKQIQTNYIKITNYYVPNQQNINPISFAVFDQLRQTHRKLIKSFDMNDSIWYIAENIVLAIYCQEIQKKLYELKIKIDQFMSTIRNKYPRLFLLSDQQLLLMMSSGTKIQKYVSKCFRHIQQIDIKQGAIQRIGKRKHLKFFQPMYILDKLSMVYEWMPKFQQTIKKNMKDLYKTNFISTITNSKKPLGFVDNYPVQLAVLDQFIQFTRLVEEALTANNLNSLTDMIKKKIYESIKSINDSNFTLLYIKFRQILSELIKQDVIELTDFTWYKNPRFYNPQSLSHIQPKILIMNQQYEYGFNYYQTPQIIFHQHCFFGNTFIGDQKTGKKSICKYYSYITGRQIIVFDPDIQWGLSKLQGVINRLVDFFKISVWTGAWLFIDKMEKFTYQDFSTISECLEAVSRALATKDEKVSILGQQIKLNKDVKIFMSLLSLNNQNFPCVLVQKMRPMWVTKPDDIVLLKLFLQAKTYSYEKISEFLAFSSWIEHGEQYKKCMIDWVRKQSDKGYFRLNSLFARMVENGYLYKLKQLIGQNQKNTQFSNIARNSFLNLDDEISFVSYGGMLIYGKRNCGKTYEVLKILEKYSYVYIDMRLYVDRIKTIQSIINYFSQINPKPLFLLIRDGIQFYQMFQHLSEQNVRLVFIESDLRFLYFSLIQNLATLNFNQLSKKQFSKNCSKNIKKIQDHPQEYVIRNILSQHYDKIYSSLYSQILSSFQALLLRQFPIANIKISHAKIFKQLLKTGYSEQISFIFSCIWSYGNYIEEMTFLNIFSETFLPMEDKKKVELINLKLWNQTIVDLLNKINIWLKQGKTLSIFDLIPVKGQNKFENNLSVKVQFSLIGIDVRKVYMELGMIQNLKIIRNLNPQWKLKIQARQWLSTVVKEWTVQNNYEVILLSQAEKMTFAQIVNKILHQVKRNKSTFTFPKIRQIIIDDVHLQTVQNYAYLEHLSTYKSVLHINESSKAKKSFLSFINLQKNEKKSDILKKPLFHFHQLQDLTPLQIDHFNNIMTKIELKNCGFILGTKLNLTYLEDQKSIVLKLRESVVQNIYHQFFRSYWTQYLTLDMSVPQIFSIVQQLTKRFQEHFSLAHYKLYPFYLEPKGSNIFSLESTGVLKNKYFWLKNPLFLALKANALKLSQFYHEYLKIVVDTLPNEVQNILSLNYSLKIQKSKSQIPVQQNKQVIQNIKQTEGISLQIPKPFSFDQKTQIVPTTTFDQIRSSAQKLINEISLQQILNRSEISQFLNSLRQEQQFMSHSTSNKYEVQKVNSMIRLSKYMKQYILRTYRELKNNNIVMLGELHMQREKICKIAAKLLGWKILDFQPLNIMKKIFLAVETLQQGTKVVVMFKASDIQQKTLEQLFHVLKFNDFTPWIKNNEESKIQLLSLQESLKILKKLRFVLKMNLSADKQTQKLYQQFHTLKTHFVNIYFHTQSDNLVDLLQDFHEQKKVLKNGDTLLTNDLQLEWKPDILNLYEKYNLSKEFLINFPQNYKQNKQSQYEKLEYYRKITSQMVVNIDRLATYNSSIPVKLVQATQICSKIQQKKAKIRKQIQKIRQTKDQTQQQIKCIEQLLQDSENNKDLLNDKMQKIMAPTAAKMDRIQRKIQNLESGQFLKVKNLIKNEYAVLIVTIINLLLEEQITQPKQKLNCIGLPFTRSTLLSSLKQAKKRCNRNTQILQKLQSIQVSQAKIRQIRTKIEQLKSIGLKRVQKIGLLFKLVFEWIMLFYERKTIFDDYYMKFKYTSTHLKSELSNLSENSKQLQKQVLKEEVFTKFEQANYEKRQNKTENEDQIKKQIPQKFKKIQTEEKKSLYDASSNMNISYALNSSLQDPTAIRKKLQQQKSKLYQIESRINTLNEQKQNLTVNEKALQKHKSYLSQKMQNLSTIICSLSDKEYMKNVSSNIASYFKNIPKISFLKTLTELKYNEYMDDQRLEKYKLDIGHYFNVFSQDQAIRVFKIKYGLYHMLNEEIQCLYNVFNAKKAIVIVQDSEQVIQNELINVCQLNSYHIIATNYEPMSDVEDLILKKIKNYNKILVLNNNYLNCFNKIGRQNCQVKYYEMWTNFDQFIYRCHQQMKSLQNEVGQSQKKIIILNYNQPLIKTQFYKQTNHGRIQITFERFMTDLTSIFQLISNSQQFAHTLNKLQKKDSLLDKIQKSNLMVDDSSQFGGNSLQMATKKAHKTTKQLLNQILKISQADKQSQNYRGIIGKLLPQQIQLLINQQNSKMKQNLKNISTLTQMIVQKTYQVFQITDDQIQYRLQNQQALIKQIEQNLSQISLIQQIIELNCKMSSNYRDQSQINKIQVNKVGLPFFWIFSYLKKVSFQSQSPMFGVKQLYKEWMKCLKSLKSQNHLLFNLEHNIQKRFELSVQNSQIKKFKKQHQRQPNIISDVFKSNMRQVIKALIIKLSKLISWQQKVQLYRFLIIGFIVFFISIQMLKCKASVFKNVKQMIQKLLKLQKLDNDSLRLLENVQSLLNKEFRKGNERTQHVSQQISQVSKTLLSFLVSSNKKPQKKYNNSIWVQLVKVFFQGNDLICQLIEGLRTKNKAQMYDETIRQLYERLKSYYQIEDVIKQVFACRHQYQIIKMLPKVTNNQKDTQFVNGYPSILSIDLKQSQINSSLIIIEDNEEALGMIVQNLRQRAKLYKRDWVSLIYNALRSQQTLKTLRKINQKGKTWVYLTSFSNSKHHIDNLKKIMFQLEKITRNPTMKIFIVIPSKPYIYSNITHQYQNSEINKLLFNKYQISKFVGKTKIDFQQLAVHILQEAQKFQQFQGRQCFSIKTLQKIAVTNKKLLPSQFYTFSQIYDLLVMGFRFLTEKHKIYNKKGLASHFINFLRTYEELYAKNDRVGKNGYLNAIKFIYQHFKAISDYTLQNVKNQIEICLKLKRQNLDYKKFEQGEGQRKKSLKTLSIEQFNLQYLSVGDSGTEQKYQIKVQGPLVGNLKKKQVEMDNNKILHKFIKEAVLSMATDTMRESNYLYLINYTINTISNQIAHTYYKTGLNIQRKNPLLYEAFQNKILSKLLQGFQNFLRKFTPVMNFKIWKNSIKDEVYKIRSAEEFLKILNQVKFFKLKNIMGKSKVKQIKQGNKIVGQKQQSGFFVQRQKVEELIISRFFLKPIMLKLSEDDQIDKQREKSQEMEDTIKLQKQRIQLCKEDIQMHFVDKKILKDSFILCFGQQSSKEQIKMNEKTSVQKVNKLYLSKKQVEQILERYVIILDYSNKQCKQKEPQKLLNSQNAVCIIQLFMK